MALDLNKQGHLINYPQKEWTCSDISELPIESDSLSIPNGSICTLCKKPDYIVFAYDSNLKEWFPI